MLSMSQDLAAIALGATAVAGATVAAADMTGPGDIVTGYDQALARMRRWAG